MGSYQQYRGEHKNVSWSIINKNWLGLKLGSLWGYVFFKKLINQSDLRKCYQKLNCFVSIGWSLKANDFPLRSLYIDLRMLIMHVLESMCCWLFTLCKWTGNIVVYVCGESKIIILLKFNNRSTTRYWNRLQD